jgi:hypothetical protein
MSKQRTESAHRKALEERVTHLEEQIAFLKKQVQEHSHSISDETVLALANFVKQDIARAFVPPALQVVEAPPQAEEQEQEQPQEQVG